MSKENQNSQSALDDETVAWAACYCPEIGVYHCHFEDEEGSKDEYMHRQDLDNLIIAATKDVSSDFAKNVQQLANMCGLARLFPHKWYVMHRSGRFVVMNPAPLPDDEKERQPEIEALQKSLQMRFPEGQNSKNTL